MHHEDILSFDTNILLFKSTSVNVDRDLLANTLFHIVGDESLVHTIIEYLMHHEDILSLDTNMLLFKSTSVNVDRDLPANTLFQLSGDGFLIHTNFT